MAAHLHGTSHTTSPMTIAYENAPVVVFIVRRPCRNARDRVQKPVFWDVAR